MPMKSDLSGQRFGRWTVLGEFTENEKKERRWLCRCDCGTERYVLERNLRYGGSRSCGCLAREKSGGAHELGGKTFGSLTVLEKVDRRAPDGNIQWRCLCSCGREYVVAGTRLVTGRVTHCPDKSAHRPLLHYKSADIRGQKFRRLTALYPVERRRRYKGLFWHCRCDCGRETDVAYNDLVYGRQQSCGCRKKEHDQQLQSFLTRVSDTSLELIKSSKLRPDNTTGHRGVYRVRGKYQAKIVFQKKAWHLGTYAQLEEAVRARSEAETLLFEGTAAYYERWEARAAADPRWAEENPVHIEVSRGEDGRLAIAFSPPL